MNYNFTFFLVLCFLFSQPTYAQYPSDIQYQSIDSAIPAMPDYLNTIEDNSVADDITIKRISQLYVPWDWYPKFEYAKIQPWNSDGSLYKFYTAFVKDATTHAVVRNLPSGDLYPSHWSNTNNDLIYGFRENGEIRTYTVSDDNLQTVFTIPGYEIVRLGPGEGNIDKNDKYVALIGKDGVDLDVIIFDLQLNQIVHTQVFPGVWGNDLQTPNYIDWISVSQSGDYVGIMWNHSTTSQANPYNSHYGVEIYNTTDMAYLRRIAAYGNHGDFGYAIDGDEVFVQFWGPNQGDHVNMYYLDRLERVTIATHSDFDAAGHISCRNLNRPGWAYLSQTDAQQSGQMVALKLDNSGLVEHFGHHYSNPTTYQRVPMVVPSPDGTKVMFKSDFDAATNADETYMFEATKSNALPIDLLNFTVTANSSNEVILKWQTASESNNESFSILRSVDKKNWEEIEQISGAGDSFELIHYNSIDKHPYSGISYYRLKQADFDGSFSYSSIKSVKINSPEAIDVSIYPNPASQKVMIESDETFLEILIYNSIGQLVKSLPSTDDLSVQVNIKDLKSGIYSFKINTTNKQHISRVVVE